MSPDNLSSGDTLINGDPEFVGELVKKSFSILLFYDLLGAPWAAWESLAGLVVRNGKPFETRPNA